MSIFFSNSHTEKSAQYMSGIKKFNFLNSSNGGLVIDGKSRISIKNSLQHALILGGSGYGKSTTYIVPNLINLRNVGIYALDPSQELFNLTSKYLSKYFDVYAINLGNSAESEYWNPLSNATSKDDLMMIADAIISTAYPDQSGDATFWNDGAKSLINVLLNSVNNQPENKNLFYVYNMLNRFNDNDKAELNKHLSETLDEDTWLEYKGLVSQPEKVWGSMVSTAKIALAPISSDILKKLSSSSSINFADFRKKPSILYIIVPEHRIKENALYLSLLFREIFETLMEMPSKKDLVQYLLLDEAGNIFVPKLANYITVLRKRKTSVSLILQSIQQLHALYGKDADTIVENTMNHIYYPGLSLQTCQQLSQKIGNTAISSTNKYFPTNKKESGKTPLLSPESIRTLKNGRALFLSGNLPPIVLKLKPWYKNFWTKMKLNQRRK